MSDKWQVLEEYLIFFIIADPSDQIWQIFVENSVKISLNFA